MSRDRGGGYGQAAARAAPDVVQVADRWHLMENASQAFLDAVRRSLTPIRRALGASTVNPELLTCAERLQYRGLPAPRGDKRGRPSLAKDAVPIKEIVRRTGCSRQTVRRILRGERDDVFRVRASSLEPWLVQLDKAWAGGCRSGAELWRRLRFAGFGGSLRVGAGSIRPTREALGRAVDGSSPGREAGRVRTLLPFRLRGASLLKRHGPVRSVGTLGNCREREAGGGVETTEGRARYGDYETWYRITGTLDGGKPPLVVVHGGPGCTHDYVDSFKDLAATGRAVIHYDQVGNGRSTHLPDKGADFWTVNFFLGELGNLVDHLGIRPAYHVLGQSWGGMLGAEFAVTRPAGLKSLVIANSPASMDLWVSEANRLRADLPAEVQAALTTNEAAGTTDSPEYTKAVEAFYARHVCRVQPMPDEVQRTFKAIEADPTVYHTMNGPSEFHVIGTLRNWSVIDRLGRIEVPVLLISGRHDEATPATVQPYADNIRDVRWRVFEESSHMPHVEEKTACLAAVAGFLDDVED